MKNVAYTIFAIILAFAMFVFVMVGSNGFKQAEIKSWYNAWGKGIEQTSDNTPGNTSNSGSQSGNGGSQNGNGGSQSGNGGSQSGNGGSQSGNGGSQSGNGGSQNGNGGSQNDETDEGNNNINRLFKHDITYTTDFDCNISVNNNEPASLKITGDTSSLRIYTVEFTVTFTVPYYKVVGAKYYDGEQWNYCYYNKMFDKYQFPMPDCDTTVKIIIDRDTTPQIQTYGIEIIAPRDVTISAPNRATPGDTVKIYVTQIPDLLTGRLERVYATINGKNVEIEATQNNNVYSFIMPAGNVRFVYGTNFKDDTYRGIDWDTLGSGSTICFETDCPVGARTGDLVEFSLWLVDIEDSDPLQITHMVVQDPDGSELCILDELNGYVEPNLCELYKKYNFAFIMPETSVTILVYLMPAEN